MTLPDLRGTANLDITPFRKGTRDALNALREVTDFAKKNGTLTLTTKLAGLSPAAIQAQIKAATSGAPLPITIALAPGSVTAAVSALRAALSSVVVLNLSTLNTIQGQINTQISSLTALIAQLRALGGGAGGGGRGGAGAGISAGTRALLDDLAKLNNEYRRGDVNASQYAARLSGLQASLRTASGAAAAGTAEFKAIDAAITRTVQGLRNVESGKITQLRTELAGARQQFDAAAAAATNLAQKRAAIAAYESDLVRIRVALNGMAASGNLTAQQLGNVNRLLAQTARESNTIRGGINLGGLSGNIQNALQNLSSFVPGLAQMSSIFGTLPVPILASAAAIGVFSAGLAASFKTAAQFQQVMADIKALTQPTAEGFLQLKEAALNLGAPLGVGARESAAAILELNRAGLSAADAINGGLVGALTLAGAAGISAAEGGKLATAAMTAFGLAAEDMPRIADVFANFANQTFLGANDLSQAIAAVGPVAQSAGLELDQFSGYMAVLAQGGFKRMSDAGTSLKVMLLSLMSPAATAAKQMEKLGFSSYDAAGNLRPFTDTLDDLRERLKGMSEQGQNRVLRDLFGTDGIRAATILLKQSREEVDAVIASQGKLGEAARVAGERLETYNGAVAKLGASWEAFRITVGEKLLPMMTLIVVALKGFVDGLQGVGNTMDTLRGYALALALAIGAIKVNVIAAAAPALWAGFTTAVTGFFAAASTAATAFLALNPFALAAVGVAGVAGYANKILADTASIYDEVDRSNQESFDGLMKRIKALQEEGTELSRVQAQYLLAVNRLQQAQEGSVTGIDFFGNTTRTVDAQEVETAAQRVMELKKEMTQLRTEAQRHGQITATPGGPGLAPGQIEKREEALQSLREALNEKAFTLKVEGMTELDSALAKTGREFDALRIKVKAAFAGNLNNTELLSGLAELDKGRAAQEAAIRQKFADQAVNTARESALATQRAEIEAMRDGAAKKKALRDQEVADVQRAAKKEAEGLSDFPKQQQQIRSDARKVIAAKQQGWAEEDRLLAIETGERVASAEKAARDATIGAMEEGRAKREAVRNAELEDLKASIAEKVEFLANDPEAQRRVQNSGTREIAAKEREQNRQRVKEAQDTGKLIQDAEASARDGVIAAMTDGLAKREAIRARDLNALRKNIAEKVAFLAGDPEAQNQVQASGQQEINAKVREQVQQRVKEEQTAQEEVTAARKAARDAEIAAIQDEGQRREAERQREIQGIGETAQKRFDALADYPEKQRAILAAANEQTRNLEQQYAQQDQQDATERAQRIADAFLKAQDARFAAEKTGRDNQAAQYELDLARRLAAAQGNAVKTAQIEQAALQVRAAQTAAAAAAQLGQDQKRLADTRDRALSDTKLSADERTAIWQEYYGKLAELSGTFQAGEKTRLAQQESDARAAAEAVRLARIGEADRPVQQSQSRVQELQQSRDLATSDAELLTIAQQISAERSKQVKLLGDQLIGLDGVNLTTQERAAVEEKIKGLQHDQAVSLKDQQAVQKSLRDSTLDRLGAEAQYAEKVARTSAELEAARQKQLSVAQTRLRELDGQIAAEGQEEKRNVLVGQRLGLLGQIADLTQKISAQPLEDDRRRLKLYEAQAQVKLLARGQQNDEVATSQLALQIAAQGLLYANAQVAAAQNKLETDAAVTEQAQARLTLAQAYAAVQAKAAQTPLSPPSITATQDPRKGEQELRQQALDDLGRELELQNRLQDVAEARARGLAQVRGLADDAVGSAALELKLTRERLALTEQQLGRTDLGAAGRADLQQKRIDLLLKEEEQQRKLNDTRRAAARLTGELERAEGNLTESLAGGNAESNKVAVAGRQVTESRRLLAAAERDYAQAKRDADQVASPANLEKLKTATNAVADAVGNHRTAVHDLAGEYRSLIGQMDGVREAGDKLRQVAYGDTQPFQADRERERLSAIAQRRDAAQRELAQALTGGRPEQIARAAEELTKEQERYNRQIEMLGKNGVKVSDVGQRETRRLADAVDALGIQYDREAVALGERARITDQEAENALTLQGAADTFDAGTDRLVAALEGTYASLSAALAQDKKERDQQVAVDRELAQRPPALAVPTLPPRQPAALPQLNDLDRLANSIAGAIRDGFTAKPEPKSQSESATDIGLLNLLKFLKEKAEAEKLASERQFAALMAFNAKQADERRAQNRSTATNTTAANNYAGDTYNLTVNGAPGQSAEAVADIAIRKLEDRARRSGRRCPP